MFGKNDLIAQILQQCHASLLLLLGIGLPRRVRGILRPYEKFRIDIVSLIWCKETALSGDETFEREQTMVTNRLH